MNNNAIYGNINAAFPFRIEMEFSKEQEIVCMKPSENCYITFPNIASGSQLNFSIIFSIKDIYNETCDSLKQGFTTQNYLI